MQLRVMVSTTQHEKMDHSLTVSSMPFTKVSIPSHNRELTTRIKCDAQQDARSGDRCTPCALADCPCWFLQEANTDGRYLCTNSEALWSPSWVSRTDDGVDFSYMDHLVSSSPSSAISTQAPQVASEVALSDHDDYNDAAFQYTEDNIINPLDAALPRELLYRTIDVFLTYLYPLYPLPHWPTLVNDISGRREERSGEEEWTTMVLGIVGYTIAQVPCQIVRLSKTDARDLVERCTKRVSDYLAVDYTRVSWERRESSRESGTR
jgi:hypothetical protein